MQPKKEGLNVIILKLIPGLLSILAIIAGNLELFKGINKHYSLSVFFIIIGLQIFFSIKYKLASWKLFLIYLLVAFALMLSILNQ